MNRLPSFSRGRGFSLIEVLLSLGVAAVLLVASFFVYANVSESAKTRQGQDQVRSISAGIRALFPQGDYAQLNNRVALDAGIIPHELRRQPDNPSSTQLQNPWGGTLTVSGTNHTSASGQCGDGTDTPRCTHFRIVMNQVPSSACVGMLTAIGGEYDLVWAIHAGNDQGMDNPNLLDDQGRPDIPRITEACNDADLVNIRFAAR